jgi:hypothetical protein
MLALTELLVPTHANSHAQAVPSRRPLKLPGLFLVPPLQPACPFSTVQCNKQYNEGRTKVVNHLRPCALHHRVVFVPYSTVVNVSETR